jgi:nicotinamide mononucleotide (NMN) deamidase PncC
MSDADRELIERIHATGTPLVLAVTGGGSGAISALLQVPGASASVLEAVVPYAARSLEKWLGGPPDQAASERTARAMAMAAFQRARELTNGDSRTLRGIGATCSLATARAKRGSHRIHVAWQSAVRTVVVSCELAKGERTRAEEEVIATNCILSAVAEACEVQAWGMEQEAGGKLVKFQRRQWTAMPEWTALLLGEADAVFLDRSAISEHRLPTANPKPEILFPGAFNPVHAAHEQMAALAEQRYNLPVTWELSITNVDKPPLDFIEIADRLTGLAGRHVLLPRAPTFVEKAALAPGCRFVVGIDTIARIAEACYYGDDPAGRDEAIATVAARGCRFLVFGRVQGNKFLSVSDLNLPPALRELCDEVPAGEFRQDVSSTRIRAERGQL